MNCYFCFPLYLRMLEKLSDVINITNFTSKSLQILELSSQEVIQIFIYYLVEVQPFTFFSISICKIFVIKFVIAFNIFPKINID